jgi:heptosyltransferase-2
MESAPYPSPRRIPLEREKAGRRLLVRGTNWLGDAIMTTPALLRLRERFPEAHIALLTPEKLCDLWVGHPAINETIPLARGESVFAVGRKLRAGQFDLALVLPNSPRSAIETWLAGIPQRIGYARPWRNFFLTQVVPPRPGAVKMQKRSAAEIKKLVAADGSQRPIADGGVLPNAATAHQIHEYLHLAAALGANTEPVAPQVFVAPDEIAATRKKFGLEKITEPILGMNPGAEYGPAKRWPAANFIAAAVKVQTRCDCRWLIFGGQGDTIIAQQIELGLGGSLAAINFSGKTSLHELMALLRLCRVLLTNDSGPMHLAAALGTPVVVPFGSTSPELTGPGLPGDCRHHLLKSDAPCSPCFLRECPVDFRCMNSISADRVAAAVIDAVKPAGDTGLSKSC